MENFDVEDFFDFSNEDDAVISDGTFESVTDSSSTVTAVDSCNSISSSFSACEPNFVAEIGCRSFVDANFSTDLICNTYEDLPHLEWMSNFIEESESSNDLQKLQLTYGVKLQPDESSKTRGSKPEPNNEFADIITVHSHKDTNPNNNNPIFEYDVSVPAKARSKRARVTTSNWVSSLLVQSPESSSSNRPYDFGKIKTIKSSAPRKNGGSENETGDGRRCWHCATDKTPQWRTGPDGPKTLCNACGVRYKSGRLMPEYRPAASPTFVMAKHSNSHRKVLELRRQNEIQKAHPHPQAQTHHHQQQSMFMQHHQQQSMFMQHHQNMVFDVSNDDDYLIHQHVRPDFRQLI